MELHGSRCPLCSGTRIRGFSAIAHDMVEEARISLKECMVCGLAWQFPRSRSLEASVDRHAHGYETKEAGSYYDRDRRRATVQTELDFLDSLFAAPGRLLDVGAGDGAFIAQAAARGWRCVGVDPAARLDPGLEAASGSAFRLVRGTVGDIDRQQTFDAITLWDVIEHLDDPEDVLSEAVGFLASDGVLFIETGNFQSAERVLLADDWWDYAADHRWYWAPPTVYRLLARLGFDHVAFGTRVLRPWWNGTHAYHGPSALRTLKKIGRSPSRTLETLNQYRMLRLNTSQWRQWGGLGIVTLAASRVPLSSRAQAVDLVHLHA